MENPIIVLIQYLLSLYFYIVLAAVIVSWLIAFNVINTYNNFVRSLLRALTALTEPVFRQIRRVIPTVAGLDFSPMIVLIAIWWLNSSVIPWLVGRFHLY
jgi:YggT family protein